MEVDKKLLQTMFREYLALNNDFVEDVAIIFLKQIGLSDREIVRWLDLKGENYRYIKDFSGRDLTSAQEHLNDSIEDTEHYFDFEEEE